MMGAEPILNHKFSKPYPQVIHRNAVHDCTRIRIFPGSMNLSKRTELTLRSKIYGTALVQASACELLEEWDEILTINMEEF